MAKHHANWKRRPGAAEFEAAFDYLTLQFPTEQARRIVARLKKGSRIERVAKDLLRACELPMLPPEERHVANDLKKIRKGKPIAPILLVQGDLARGRSLLVADGYHRICAAFHADEDAPVAALMVGLDERPPRHG
jgi:hypothetical protein